MPRRKMFDPEAVNNRIQPTVGNYSYLGFYLCKPVQCVTPKHEFKPTSTFIYCKVVIMLLMAVVTF
jgi:hypothetical protein